MDYVNTLNTENIETPCRRTIIHVSRPTFGTLFTMAANNTKAIFVSEVKNACSEFVTDVCDLIGGEVDYDVENDSELTRKIVANEFESIIVDLKNMINSLEQR